MLAVRFRSYVDPAGMDSGYFSGRAKIGCETFKQGKDMSLTIDRLKEVLHYAPETGQFTWLVNKSSTAMKGDRAGKLHSVYGYRLISVDNTTYRAGRLAFFYMEGYWPVEIDHINRERNDDRWVNLRNVSRQENNRNRGKPINNVSGYLNVTRHANRWRVTVNGKYVGRFFHLQDAVKAAEEARANGI